MSDALKAGSVYVAVTASIGEFTKSMQDVIKQAQETAKKIKEAATAVAGVGALFAAGIVKAVQEAAKANVSLNRDTERFKKLLYTLVGDIGDLFAPAVHQLTEALGRVVGVFQRLDPGVKSAVAHFALFAAGAGAVAAGVAGAAGLVEALAKTASVTLVPALKAAHTVMPQIGAALKGTGAALAQLKDVDVLASLSSGMKTFKESLADLPGKVSGLGRGFLSIVPQVFAVAAPLAAVAAAAAGIALAAGAVYEAWTDTSTGLRETVLGAVESLKGYAAKLGAFFQETFTSLRNLFLGLAAAALETVLAQVRAAASGFEALLRAARQDVLADELAKLQNLTGASVVEGLSSTLKAAGEAAGKALSEGVGFVADVGKDAAANVVESLGYSVKGLKHMLGDAAKATGLSALLEKMEGLLDQLRNGDQADLRKEPRVVDVSKVGGYGVQDFEKVRALGRSGGEVFTAAIKKHAQILKEAAEEHAQILKEAAEAHARALAEAIATAKDELKSRLRSAVAPLAEVADTFVSGLTASGGNPLVAVGAVLADFLTKSKGFSTLMEMVSNMLQRGADILGAVLTPLQSLVGAVSQVLDAVLLPLAPLFGLVGQVLEPLTPVLVVVADTLQVLQPLFKMFAGYLQLVSLPLRLIVEVELRAFFEGVKYLGAGLLWVAEKISGVWNGIVDGVQWLLHGLAKLPLVGGAFDDMAKLLDGVKVDTDALKASQQELLSLTWDQAAAKAAETAATLKNTQALNQATESLTNVPSAWKVTLARFNAQDARASPFLPPASSAAPPASTSTVSPASSAPVASAQAAPALQIDTINVSASSPAEALDALEKHLNNLAFRRRGTSAGLSRYALGDG